MPNESEFQVNSDILHQHRHYHTVTAPIKLQWVGKGGLWSASFSNRYVRALPQCVLRCSGVFADRPVSNVCATVCATVVSGDIWIEYLFPSFFPYLCCSGLDGEQIYRPCPYRIRRALFLQLCRAMLAWLWRPVTVRDERRRKSAKVKQRDCFPPSFLFSFFSFFLFLFSFSYCPTRLCTRRGGTDRTCPAAFAKESGWKDRRKVFK